MTDTELKDTLFGKIYSLSLHFVSLERYKIGLEDDDTWQDAVDKTSEKIRELIREIKNIIYDDLVIRSEIETH